MKRRPGRADHSSAGSAELRRQLAEAQRTIDALLAGQVDAVLDPQSTSALLLRQAQDELRRLNQELGRTSAHFRALIENVTDIITILEPDGTIRYTSPASHSVLGYDANEMVGALALGFVHPDDAGQIGKLMREALEGRTAALVSYRFRHKNGTWRRLESTGLNMLANPAVAGIVVTSRDVTERFEIEGRYRALFENMVEGFAHCRMFFEGGRPVDFVYLEVNRAFARLTGMEGVEGRRWSELPGTRETNYALLEMYGRVATSGRAEKGEYYVPHLQRWFSISAYGPEPGHFVAVFDNITERKQIEERLERSEAEHRGLVERAPLAIYRSTLDGRFLSVNPALVRMLGCGSAAEVLATPIPDLYVNPEERLHLLAAASREQTTASVQWKRKDGERITVHLHYTPIFAPDGAVQFFDVFAEDVTEQRNLERQLRQAQKMEAVGRLAGGVAHDFNNLLTAITGYAELLLLDLPEADPRREDVKQIRSVAQRAADLTRQLLAFSRRQVLQTRVLDLNEVVRAIEKMLERLIGEDVHLRLALTGEAAIVRADAGQVEQVLVNLAINARDAMPGGGELTIETALVELDAEYVSRHEGAATGPYVMVAVSDTGVGMDADTLSHVFEPFFTTKEAGKGTGLGLATVYGIVKQSGGSVWAYSEPGRGTTFKVFLPRVQESAVPAQAAAPVESAAGRGETILVAEDDPAVRQIVSRCLSMKGYQVLLAPGGAAALDLARTHTGRIDLLLTDLVMPDISGRELASAVVAARPDTRVLFMSGYTDDTVVRHGVLEAGVHYLQKPFSADGLATKVRAVLDAVR